MRLPKTVVAIILSVPVAVAVGAPPAAPPPGRAAMEFLERRVKSDPDDFTAWNRLGALYLQRMRETGSVDYLKLAGRAADKSLAAAPADVNAGGVVLRARACFVGHDFVTARDLARRLEDDDPGKPAYPLLRGDALLELGEYPAAEQAFARVAELSDTSIESETRASRVAFLKGDPAAARAHMEAALAGAGAATGVPAEAVAWCHWQLGELSFLAGDYAASESHDRKALDVFPGYYRARGGLARALAAEGKTADAIAAYEKAIETVPDPVFVSALYDLYAVAGRPADAAAMAEVMEGLGKLAAVGSNTGGLYDRPRAVFYANHGMKPGLAYAMTAKEYEVRKDVYGADAVAWTALKAGKVDAARAAAKDALELGTKDPNLLYHAGMVALAANDRDEAAKLLAAALAMSPQFDPVQAPKAAEALRSIGAGAKPVER